MRPLARGRHTDHILNRNGTHDKQNTHIDSISRASPRFDARCAHSPGPGHRVYAGMQVLDCNMRFTCV